MFAALRHFRDDDTAATTVDWVVLTGGIVALTVIMLSTMNGSMSSVATEMEVVLDNVEVVGLDDLGDDGG